MGALNECITPGVKGFRCSRTSAPQIEVVRFVTSHCDLPVIGVGGISTARDGLRMLDAGASLLQIYTGFVYSGPPLLSELNRAIANRA